MYSWTVQEEFWIFITIYLIVSVLMHSLHLWLLEAAMHGSVHDHHDRNRGEKQLQLLTRDPVYLSHQTITFST